MADTALLVPDQDEALRFYVGVLGFDVIEDHFVDGKRWVRIKAGRAGLVLRQATDEAQRERVGAQTGHSVFLFLETDDFAADYRRLQSAGVRFVETPRHESYGTVVVFLDPFGNKLDLIEPSQNMWPKLT
jgi:catechol 2,3-dioxygenase-like lactoylglutathione lyase family enzyme